ncbi:MAG: STAS domain-containing protein [Bacteroidota bacterium]
MEMAVQMLEEGIKKIDLFGRMDIEGTQKIDLKLALEFTVEKALIVLDLSQVDFMASIGIGALVSAARSLKLRRGKMVLLNPQPFVERVLEQTHINTLIPIYQNFEDAKKALFDKPSPL